MPFSYCRFVNRPLLFNTTNQQSPKVVGLAAKKVLGDPPDPFFSLPPHKEKKSGLGTRLYPLHFVVSHCTYCGMTKGTSWAEVTSNSEKLKPVALAIIKLCLSEGISQSVTYLLSQ